MFNRIKRFGAYLFKKRSEIEDMDFKDVVMAKTILDIHRARTHKERMFVPLFSLHPIHRLDRENAITATEQRVRDLEQHRPEWLRIGDISSDLIGQALPSVSWIKVVENPDRDFLAFEGNGRLSAMQQVFKADDGIRIEVEAYRFRRPKTIIRRLNRVRRMNGLV